LRWGAVIVAAGRGARLGRPKQLLDLAGLPMVGWSIQTFASLDEIADLVVVTEPDLIETIRALIGRVAHRYSPRVVGGGATRQASVREGLRALPASCDAVLVHDGARPLVSTGDVRAGMHEVGEGRAALLAAPLVDTIKVVTPGSMLVTGTLDRSTLWAAQTPQFAWASDMRRAHERASAAGLDATDDATLLERIGVAVVAVPASAENFKVTLPQDVARAAAILHDRSLTTRVPS
jgi:2-C-methyl-D-erythritol 4-phosphate cytidylyltransferase